jgi:putative membrane protein
VSRTIAGPDEHPVTDGQRLASAGLLIKFLTGLPQLVFPLFALTFGVSRSEQGQSLLPFVIAGLLALSMGYQWLAWYRFRYHVNANDIRIESGVLSRNARSIPYEHIQDISIEQKLLARLFGLAEVKFETGGGDGDDAKLSYVSIANATNLRELVRARKIGSVAVDVAKPDISEKLAPIFVMDGKRVFTLGLYSFSLVIFAALGGLAQQFDSFLPFDIWDFGVWIGMAEDRGVSVDRLNGIGWGARLILALGALLSLLFVGFATGVVRTLLKEHGFRLDRTAKGFRRRRGLLTLTDAVMPVHRVQAAVIQTGPIRKRHGWHSLKFVSLAQDSKEESNFVAVPFATLDEIWPIAREAMIEGPGTDMVFRKGAIAWWWIRIGGLSPVVAAIIGLVLILADAPLATAAWLALALVPVLICLLWVFDWRQYRDSADDRFLYVGEGWWRQRLTIAPQIKIQTVEIAQGPIARRQGLASLRFGIAGGTLEMIALPLTTAQHIRLMVIDRVSAIDYSAIAKG